MTFRKYSLRDRVAAAFWGAIFATPAFFVLVATCLSNDEFDSILNFFGSVWIVLVMFFVSGAVTGIAFTRVFLMIEIFFEKILNYRSRYVGDDIIDLGDDIIDIISDHF